MLQFHRMSVVSDLITLKVCSHLPGFAISVIFSLLSFLPSRQSMLRMLLMWNGYDERAMTVWIFFLGAFQVKVGKSNCVLLTDVETLGRVMS